MFQETLVALKDMKEEADKKKANLVDQQQAKAVILDEQEQYRQQRVPVYARLKEIVKVERNIAGINAELGQICCEINYICRHSGTSGSVLGFQPA